ncbi:MAG: hypothetical protein K9J35_09005 [Rhodoferax sp.]|uniref:hypothetical protein n=1 Tax=Polynucleobacter sp. MG-Unter2-18 TaxID=2081052 RepID=UPI001BFD608E|nr:hypothetical protein [Polynucleobacter sp. MG-Unter2-18]MCF8166792.1 hypothetical protein [Rhodoferax sp.]MCF8190467.1 hypothetical protein [Polynucleobacter sp.]QWD94925.1 hypothetical protein C2759_01975 [Polynucleobacter sp. MG-Unter2-18]
MRISAQFRIIYISSVAFGFVSPSVINAQTFFPYTPTQIQEFNSQPIAPIETPAGPVYQERPPISQRPNVPFDARYIKNPDGEEQAEAQGAQSATPFEPIPATLTF